MFILDAQRKPVVWYKGRREESSHCDDVLSVVETVIRKTARTHFAKSVVSHAVHLECSPSTAGRQWEIQAEILILFVLNITWWGMLRRLPQIGHNGMPHNPSYLGGWDRRIMPGQHSKPLFWKTNIQILKSRNALSMWNVWNRQRHKDRISGSLPNQ